LRARAPGGKQVELVRNGFDPEDFPNRGAAAASDPASPLRLVHTGMLTLTRSAASLLRALRKIHDERPALRDAFRIELVGARESENDALVGELGLGHCVALRGYVPHAEAIAAMRAADVLVLVKHVEPRFTGLVPGKLYEYMGAARPILALVPPSEAADLVRDNDWGIVVPPDDPPAIAAALLDLLDKKRLGELDTSYAMRGRTAFERPSQARAVARILDALVAHRAPAGALRKGRA
jgi:glycosyltransferase involved in cell wall biosynthesis